MENYRTLKTTDGATLSYRLLRSSSVQKPLIVLLHGMASNMTRWSEFLEHTKLKQHWDILRLDLRGHGESFWRGRLHMQLWCEDLRAILDAEGYDQAVLIGHSLGAQVAVNFGARYPQRMRGLVLIDPVFYQALRGKMRRFGLLRSCARGFTALIRLLNFFGLRRRSIPNRDLQKLDALTRERFLDVGKQKEMLELYSSPWEDLKYFPTASFIHELMEIIRPLPSLATIPAPILALLSSAMTYTDPVRTREILAAHPRTTIVALNAYHWPLTESPVQVREAIEDWCEQLRLNKII
ncbi:MAG: alpha/beta hydrolase [Gammaproteobacteria bacterium]|nr:alpha/beta hydrolase [Gammaproteobacteria bacterium]